MRSIEARIKKMEERNTDNRRNLPCFIIISPVAYSDGTVPNLTDRQLSEWEITKNSNFWFIDVMKEYSLRINQPIEKCEPHKDDKGKIIDPEIKPPKDQCITEEQFKEWMDSQ